MTHEERQELIHRPFFIVGMGPSYPWGGTAVADNFYGTDHWAERPTPHNGDGRNGDLSMMSFGPYGLRVGDITKFGITQEDSKALTLLETEFTQNLTTRRRRRKKAAVAASVE